MANILFGMGKKSSFPIDVTKKKHFYYSAEEVLSTFASLWNRQTHSDITSTYLNVF